jgi:hypothetical protein
MMTTINVSDGKKIHSQRNNELLPIATCNTTSMIMMLKYSGVDVAKKLSYEWTQLEDSLTSFTQTNAEVDAFYGRLDAANHKKWKAKDPKAIPPNQYHAVLNFATNLWLGYRPDTITSFTTGRSIQTILFDLLQGKASVVSGVFAKLRHVVCVVGFNSIQMDMEKISNPADITLADVSHVLIDDPYGDYRTNYKDHNGDDIKIPLDEFIKLTNSSGSATQKWCHFIRGDKRG